PRVLEHPDPVAEGVEHGPARIRAAVVDHERLYVRVRLIEHGLHGFADELLPVEARNDRRDLRTRADPRSCRYHHLVSQSANEPRSMRQISATPYRRIRTSPGGEAC